MLIIKFCNEKEGGVLCWPTLNGIKRRVFHSHEKRDILIETAQKEEQPFNRAQNKIARELFLRHRRTTFSR